MGIYHSLYDLIVQYVYNENVPIEGDLVATLIATAGSLFVVAIPFILVWRIIKLLAG